jgi:Na+-transporting methylmalonyl-CoA/oxaloacetate decarboxylase gamma subunit
MVMVIVFVIILILLALFMSRAEGGSHGGDGLDEWRKLEHRRLSDKHGLDSDNIKDTV